MGRFSSERCRLSIHEDAEADLDRLFETDEDGAAAIDAFLEEVAGSQALLDRLTQDHYRTYSPPAFDVQRWQALWRQCALWRARLYDAPGTAAQHRIIYAFHPGERCIYVLGVVSRDFNYEPSHPFSKRIIRVYKDLGLP